MLWILYSCTASKRCLQCKLAASIKQTNKPVVQMSCHCRDEFISCVQVYQHASKECDCSCRSISPFLRPQQISVFGAVMHDDNPEGRVPSSQFPQPLSHDSRWTDNDAGLEHATAMQACQESRQLDGFAKAHFIPYDPSSPPSVQLPQPFYPCACMLLYARTVQQKAKL